MELTTINFHQTLGTQRKCQKVKLFTEPKGDVKTKTQEDSTTSRHTLRCHALNMKKSHQYVHKGSVRKGQRVWLARRHLTFRFLYVTELAREGDVCMTVHHYYNNINSQLESTIAVY